MQFKSMTVGVTLILYLKFFIL